MKSKTRFMKMYYKLPKEARRKLVYFYSEGKWNEEPMTLHVIAMEIMHDTELGKKILKDLGYEVM